MILCLVPVLLDIPQHVHTIWILQDCWWRPNWYRGSWPMDWILHFGRFTVIIMNCLTATVCLSFPNTSLMTFIGVWPLPCVTLLVPHIYTPVFISEWVLFAHGIGLFLNPWPHVCLFIYDFCFDILISSTFHRPCIRSNQLKQTNFFHIYTIQYYILRCGHSSKWCNWKIEEIKSIIKVRMQ